MKFRLFVILLVFVTGTVMAQEQYYRVRADFSIKEKRSTGQSNLTMGRVFYDRFQKRIVYDVLFPEKQVWLFYDTNMYVVAGENVTRKPMFPGYVDFSIFSLALNNNLANYGLQKSAFEVTGTVKENDMVITTWSPKKEYEDVLGPVKVSVKQGKLYGVLFYNKKGRLMGKQIYSSYIRIRGFEMPTELLYFYYNEDGSEIHQVTTFKNVKINDFAENEFYNYPLPR